MTLNQKVSLLADEVSGLSLERNEQIRGLILGLLSREHVLLLGPPGTAKSMTISMITKRITNTRYFETLLSRFSSVEDVFGPVSIKGLQDDRYERIVEDYMPDAEVVVIDEVFKCSSSLLNSFLSIMVERKYKNGSEMLSVPLISLVGASNETPQDESLAAMYDRFGLKYMTAYVSDSNFSTLMRLRKQIVAAESNPNKATITLNELRQAQAEVDAVNVPDAIYEQLSVLRTTCRNEGFSASDRRWMASEKILKACAWMDGRKDVVNDDLLIYKDILWDNMNDAAKCAIVVGRIINPELTRIMEHTDQIDILLKEFVAKGGGEQAAIDAMVKIRSHQAKLVELNAGEKGEALKVKINQRVRAAIGKSMGFK